MLKRGDHSKQFMNGAFLKDNTVALSLSLSVIFFSLLIYFSFSFSHTHNLSSLSQIFKANINAALFELAMKIKGGTEDCFTVFLFLFLISFFTLSHTNESYRHQASVACMR